MSSVGYIYIRNHPSYEINDACKMGKTNNIPDRDTQYATGEIKRGYFELVFELPIELIGYVERSLQNEFFELNIKYDAGTEFYDKKIINLIENHIKNLGILYKKLSKQEIDNLVRCKRNKELNYLWYERDYQKSTIKYSIDELLLKNKIYIELPTGAGKSYIVYNLFQYLKSDFIIIISPRKIINLQNIAKKYLKILTDIYITFNYSIDNNFDDYLKLPNKKIVICCTQSVDKIYEKIVLNNITNITIWFDEAHWSIEEYLHNKNAEFWLLNNINIKYRIFTSASPNKERIIKNEHIFGKLYAPIKIKELIKLKWLSTIKPYVYSENIESVNSIKYIINDFNKQKRHFGFSFHNKQRNAFNLFYNHYTEYKNNKTDINPFLLVSDNFNIEKESRLQEIKLDYDYRDIKIYESTINSIGYVVAKYSMGYDFNKLDFICLSDPKLSIQDIKQCIGRGIRPDELGIYGSNKEKSLIISLPVYIKENNKYETVIEVLKYLLHDIEIPLSEIEFKNRHKSIVEKENTTAEYTGINDVKSILLDLLELDNKRVSTGITYEKARKIIADKNIKDKESYYKLCETDNRLSKEPDIIYKGQFTNWIDYLSIKRVYYELENCKSKINEYLTIFPEIKKNYLNLSIISKQLSEIDDKFPPYGLWVEYYNVKDLNDIIIIINKKKKMGAVL
jgi:hypothetical protein